MPKIKITIEYQELNQSEWKIFEVPTGDYFDCDSVNEDLSWESVPLYNHAVEYLPVQKKKVQATKLVVDDQLNKVVRKIYEYFWNDGNSQLIEVTDEGLNNNRHEIIISLLFSEKPNVTQIVRCHKENGLFKPNYIGLITENIDGTETEQKFF